MLLSLAPGRPIPDEDLARAFEETLARLPCQGGRILLVVPDDTRTLPMPLLFSACRRALVPRARSLSFLVALGTHPPMTEQALRRHFGYAGAPPADVTLLQHDWRDPRSLSRVGALTAREVREISGGLLQEELPVEINGAVLDADLVILVGPVYPHELVGFSGGSKYLFPGVSGSAMVHQTHWLGALITNPQMGGRRDTPPRAMIEAASRLVPGERRGISLVMKGHDVHGVFTGGVREAWESAVELSSRINIRWVRRPFSTVVSCAPAMYQDLWTGAKCMTKLEPVVADGGTLILYAPHIRSAAPGHGSWHEQIGYHVRDYFLAHMDRHANVPRAVLADLTQLRGIGTYRDGVERTRITVKLATGIPREGCRRLNLDWEDPDAWAARLPELEKRAEEGVLVVRDAGEVLYRLADGTVPAVEAP